VAARNPPWEYDELVLALELYLNDERARQSKTDPAVAKLSQTLRSLDLGIERPDPEKFRNVNGVFMKLQNFKAVDPTYEGEGLGRGATGREAEVWERFADDPDALKQAADAIRSGVPSENLERTEEEAETVVEGRVLYSLHRRRERRRGPEKKRKVLRETGRLRCEVCGFDFVAIVCSNCHRMLHRGERVLSTDELREVMDEARPDQS
jgi:5-methylcytosine-specific restriction protein A